MRSILVNLVAKALERRASMHSDDVYRLVDQAGDDIPGLWIDRYGAVALMHQLEQAQQLDLSELAQLQPLFQKIGVQTLLNRSHVRKASETAENLPAVVFGNVPHPYTVAEGQLRFEVDPYQQVNAGLFVDMRCIRQELCANLKGARVINLFAFTGTLGVAAACGGAREVIQVDVSKGALTWAKRNQALNSSAQACNMRYFPDDVRDYLRRECRRVERGQPRSEIVLLDPPSFGHTGATPFQVEEHLPELLQLSCRIVTEGGTLYATCNYSEFSAELLAQKVQQAAVSAGRKVGALEPILPPADFTATPQNSLAVRGVRAQIL